MFRAAIVGGLSNGVGRKSHATKRPPRVAVFLTLSAIAYRFFHSRCLNLFSISSSSQSCRKKIMSSVPPAKCAITPGLFRTACLAGLLSLVSFADAQVPAKPQGIDKGKPMQQVTSQDGTRIAYDKVGKGPAVVIVNGALSSRSSLSLIHI